MNKIYIAAPLFSSIERRFNKEIDVFLKSLNLETYLPQRDARLISELVQEGISLEHAQEMVFEKDIEAIKDCCLFLIILDGRVPDEGACVELGFAYAMKRKCLGYKTDNRSLLFGSDNPMITQILQGRIARNFTELAVLVNRLV